MSNKKQQEQDTIWEFYQNEKAFAEYGCPSGGRHEFLARQMKEGLSVLNIGIGRGTLERLMVERGVTVSCLDPSSRTVENVSSILGPRGEARVGHAEKIPWPEREFDVVIMTEVLEHLDSATIGKALEDVARVLKPSGYFFGTVPADENLEASMVICPKCGDRFHRWGHQRSLTKESLHALLSLSFEKVELRRRSFADINALNFWGIVSYLYKKLLSNLGMKTGGQNFVFWARGPKIDQGRSLKEVSLP
jgi:ubiquinone/menaquinone biosynthesis C-methylase UbiE